MRFLKQFKLIAVLAGSTFVSGHMAQAQVIEGTLKCNPSTCLAFADGTLWNLDMTVTARCDYNGTAVSLEAYADVQANNCSTPVLGQVDGGTIQSTISGSNIGIAAQAYGSVAGLTAEYAQINYCNGSLIETGGGLYPC